MTWRWLARFMLAPSEYEVEVLRRDLAQKSETLAAANRLIADLSEKLLARENEILALKAQRGAGLMAVAEHNGFAPGEAAGELVASGIGMVAGGIQGTLGAVGHLENIAVAVPNTVVQTAASLEGEAAGAADRGFDTVLANVRKLLEQADAELQAGVREFGSGLPKVG